MRRPTIVSRVSLSSLVILSIESQRLDDVFIDLIIEISAHNEAHNKSF